RVKVQDCNGVEHVARVLLDNGSTANFVTASLCGKLGLSRRSASTTVTVYIYISFHILLHTCIKLDLVALDIKEMFTDLDSLTMTLPLDDERRIATQRTLRQRMKIIVDRHVSVFT
ncbi:hypothetical protein ACJJTC_016775, partial [Scirpophaga incertulas]